MRFSRACSTFSSLQQLPFKQVYLRASGAAQADPGPTVRPDAKEPPQTCQTVSFELSRGIGQGAANDGACFARTSTTSLIAPTELRKLALQGVCQGLESEILCVGAADRRLRSSQRQGQLLTAGHCGMSNAALHWYAPDCHNGCSCIAAYHSYGSMHVSLLQNCCMHVCAHLTATLFETQAERMPIKPATPSSRTRICMRHQLFGAEMTGFAAFCGTITSRQKRRFDQERRVDSDE